MKCTNRPFLEKAVFLHSYRLLGMNMDIQREKKRQVGQWMGSDGAGYRCCGFRLQEAVSAHDESPACKRMESDDME